MSTDFRNFLALSYEELEEKNLQAKHDRINRVAIDKVKEERLKWLTLCRDIRHALAHQEPASAAQLLRLDRWWRDTH